MSPSTSTGSKGSLRNKAIAGGAVGLLALGIWIGSWFQGFGLGGGATGGAPGAASVDQGEETSSDEPSTESVSVELAPPVGHSPAARGSTAAPETVSVMIYGDSYRLPKSDDADLASGGESMSEHFQEASLEQVIDAASGASGNANGIKVLVYRHKTATVGALNRLLKGLRDAGLRNEQMHQLSDFYD